MGNYLADGLMSGFQNGTALINAKRDREQRERAQQQRSLEAASDRNLRRELSAKDDGIREATAARIRAESNRLDTLTPAELASEMARARGINASAQRTETLTPYEASDLQATTRGRNATAAHTETITPLDAEGRRIQNVGAQLSNDLGEMKLREMRRTFEAGPTAKVKQSLGPGSDAEFTVPVAQAQRMAGAANYQSPYADRIAAFDEQISQQEAEMQGGDERTGLFNLKSRQDELSKLTQRRTRLQALEIQDMLRKGMIDDAEADRRAAQLLSFR